MNITFNEISKSFGDTKVFRGLNLTIKDKQITCIIGASGIGKTTLLNLLLGLERPDLGYVKGIEGKKIVAVFQEDRLVENLSAIKNVELVCKKEFSKDKLIGDFTQVGLQDFKNKEVSRLSGGMKRRVAIVRAVFVESDIILMDEPFKGLDAEIKSKVIEYIKDKSKGKTVIIVTHNVDEIKELNANKIDLNFTNIWQDVIMYKLSEWIKSQ